MDGEDRLAARDVGWRDEHLPVEATGAKKRRVEILEPVGGGHHDDLVTGVEAVELDEELVQSLVVLPVDGTPGPGSADGVELVDEDDRRRVLAGLFEELADSGSAEPREHLDERGSALRVEVRAGRAGDGLREQRLPRPRGTVQQDSTWDARA